jgi:hypothetical protein
MFMFTLAWRVSMLLGLSLACGCLEAVARRQTHGAITATQERIQQEAVQEAVTELARKTAAGTFEKLTTEERRAVVAEIGREVARAATASMHEELTSALGTGGEGPLTMAISRAAERATTTALFPQCTGADRSECIRSQIELIARAASNGFIQTIHERLGLTALIAAFVAGILAALAALSVWTTLRARRDRAPTTRRPVTT